MNNFNNIFSRAQANFADSENRQPLTISQRQEVSQLDQIIQLVQDLKRDNSGKKLDVAGFC